MKLLFVHDVKALVYKDKVYARSYGKNIWDRYLKVFDEIKVCARSKLSSRDVSKEIELLSVDKVSFDRRIGLFRGPEIFFSNKVKKILAENIENHDGIVIRLDSFLGLMAVNECRKQNKSFIIEVVGCAWDSFWNHGISGKILAPFMFLMMRRAVKNAPFTIYVTKEFLQNRYPTLGVNTNISNVELPLVDDKIITDRINKISNLNQQDCLHLMTTANVGVRYKGFQYVIKALGRIKKLYGKCNYVYHIVGEGDQSYLREVVAKEKVANNVIFHGPISHDEVFSILKEVDIYIQPSLQEGLPRAMIEAMSYGLPCIGTDVAGIPELINPRFIYKRKKNMPKQIVNLLGILNKDTLIKEAVSNFKLAKEYDSRSLNARRTEFLRKYEESL